MPRRLRENWEQTNPLRQSLECRYSPVVLVVLSLRSPVSTVVDQSAGILAIENMRIYGTRVSGRDDNEVKRIRYFASLHNGFSRERFRLSWFARASVDAILRVLALLRSVYILDPRCKRFP